MLKQDATATLAGLDIGPAEYYSVAFRRDDAGLAGKDTELAGFVNGVLESIRRDPPAWMALCEEWEVPEMPCDESMPPEPQWAR
ncbi:hypothetical protein [Frankia sp. EI5c]|uniref:hypothetical protein n=1 Tax=Frankia sp. EI5c TaxID=683316 RepID=UPI0037BFCC8B